MTPRRTDVGLLLAWAAAAVAVVVLAGVVAVLLLPATSTATPATAGPADSGLSAADATLLAAEPVRSTPAPGFALTDQHGRPVRLSGFRGRAVVLSFTDDRCTNICTLLAEDIVAADHDLATNRNRVAFVAVNANPYHPSVSDVRRWGDAHGLGRLPNWTYATGSATDLGRVAHAYGEEVRLDPRSRTIEHGTDLVFIDPRGDERLIGLYGTETADTAAFGHALADAAASLLPATERRPVLGAPAPPSPATEAGQTLPRLGAPASVVPLHRRGRPAVLTFFSSTCSVCASELPGIEREYRSAGARVDFVGVDVADSAPAAERLLARTGVRYPVGTDATGAVAARYGVSGLPYTVILDPAGRPVTTHPGLLTADQLHYLLQVLPDEG